MNKNFFDVFSNKELGSVRTIFETETGEAWFYANDVAKILGYSEKNLSHAIERHTSKEDRKALKYKASSVSDEAKMWGKNDFMDKIFVNESGLYCLIFGSKLPKAKEFKHWVTSEVLPSIRRHGGYIYGQENLSEDEKQELLAKIEKLSKDLNAYKADGDLWMEMYFRLEKDYLEAVKKAVPEDKVPDTPKEEVKYIMTKEGWIMPRDMYVRDER